MNIPLFSAIFSIAATVLIGVLMVILFVNELATAPFVIGSVVLGALIALPIALTVTKKMSQLTGKPE